MSFAVLFILMGFSISTLANSESSQTSSASSSLTSNSTTSASITSASSASDVKTENSSKTSLIRDYDSQKNLYFSFNSFAFTSYRGVQNSNGNIDSVNYVSLNYKLNRYERVSIRPTFSASSSGVSYRGERTEKTTSKTNLSDLQLVYSNRELGTIGDIDTSLSLKLYLPTSEFSQKTELIAKIRPETYFDYTINPSMSLSYLLKPDFYIQAHNYYIDETTSKNKDGSYKYDPRKVTRKFALEHGLGLYNNINRKFGYSPYFAFIEEWSNSQEDLGERHSTDFKSGVSMDWRVMRQLSFTLGLENRIKIADRKDPVMFFHPNENSVYLITNASL